MSETCNGNILDQSMVCVYEVSSSNFLYYTIIHSKQLKGQEPHLSSKLQYIVFYADFISCLQTMSYLGTLRRK